MKALLCFALAGYIGYVSGHYFGFAALIVTVPVGLILGMAAAA